MSDRADRVITLAIYSRPGCHLCDEMKSLVRRVAAGVPSTEIEVVETDISGSPDLERLYGLEVPVLMVNGRKMAKYRVEEAQLVRMIRAAGTGKAG